MTRRMPLTDTRCWTVLLVLWSLVAFPATGLAQIRTDGSLGAAKTLTGPNYAIPSSLGTTVGANLFHSFSTFNVLQGESATFSGASSIRNVLARVTGGSASSIDGLLACSIPGANLFLVNPAGVVFGPNARLDVSGSFCATTADRIHLGSDGVFAATNPSSSLLTVADPSAFGFVSASPAAITVNQSTLKGQSGASLTLAGGDIRINQAQISTISGDIVIQSAGGPGRIAVDPSAQGPTDMPFWGNINLTDNIYSSSWLLSARGTYRASIFIRGGTITANGASMLTGGRSYALANGDITVVAENALRIENLTLLQTATTNSVNAGNIFLISPTITINDSHVYSTTQSSGNSGNIGITATTNLFCNNSQINTDTWSYGDAGIIIIQSNGSLLFDQGSMITSDSIPLYVYWGSPGASGIIHLMAPRVEFAGASQASATSYSNAQDSGTIRIDADTFSMTGSSTLLTDIHSENPLSTAGRIDIHATTVDLTDSVISSTPSYGYGQGGNISIAAQYLQMRNSTIYAISPSMRGSSGSITLAASTIDMSGSYLAAFTYGTKAGGDITVTADSLSLDNNSGILNSTYSAAPAGNIVIRGGNISLRNTSFMTASTFGAGAGGRVDIAGDASCFSDGSFLQTDTQGPGNAGSILVDVNTLQILNSSGFNASTAGAGAGGDIVVTANAATVSGGSAIFTDALASSTGQAGTITLRSDNLLMDDSRIRARAQGSGPGGSIAISTGWGLIQNGSLITTQSLGLGNAGTIIIQSPGDFTLIDSRVTTEAASANGGNIFFDVGRRLDLRHGGILTSVHGGSGDGGNISINSGYLLSDSGTIQADADMGHGGNINIWTRAFVATPDTVVSASSRAGLDGQIMLAANILNMAGNLVVLPGSLLDVDRLIPQHCEYRDPRVAGSSFLILGRRGVPPAPGSQPR